MTVNSIQNINDSNVWDELMPGGTMYDKWAMMLCLQYIFETGDVHVVYNFAYLLKRMVDSGANSVEAGIAEDVV